MKKLPIYGRSPIHLLGLLICYGLATYAGVKLFGNVSWWVALAFPAGIALHDFVLFPIYRKANHILSDYQVRQLQKRKDSVAWINYVRLPIMISLILLLCYFPIILQLAEDRHLYTGLSQDTYLYRWLIVSTVLAAGSAVAYFWRSHKAKASKAEKKG